MNRVIAALALALTLAVLPSALVAQDATKAAKAPAPKVGKDEKLCQYRFPSGERRTWVCKKDEPCCAWDAISYVKCGSPVFKCL